MSVLARYVILLIAVFVGTGLAQPSEVDLAEATDLARAHSLEIAAAESDLHVARRDLERVGRDPLATGLERIQATHAVAASIEALAGAERALRITTLQRVADVLEGAASVRDARDQADVAVRELAAEQVRADAGLITALDLARSASAAERAVRAAEEAASDQALRWTELGLHLGASSEALRERGVAPITEAPPELEVLDELLRRSGLSGDAPGARHVSVAVAERGLEVARVQLAGSDHEAASPNALEAARDAVSSAERRLADARAQAELQLRASHQTYAAALGRVADARTNDATAATTLEAQRVRADAGELSPLALRQAAMERERSADALHAARHAAWLAWWRLEQAVAG